MSDLDSSAIGQSDPLASVVIPVQNQADHIEHIVSSYVAGLRRYGARYELILVTNGCSDASPEICARLASGHESVRHVDEAEAGWGRAVRRGLAEVRGDLICYTNAARTTPEILILLLLYALTYPDVAVKANRRIRDNRIRRLGSLIYNLECRALFDLANWDINGTPKVFPRSFDRLLSLTRDDDLIDLEFHVVCQKEEYPIVEVPILATVRHGGRSTTNVRSALRMYWGAYRFARDRA